MLLDFLSQYLGNVGDAVRKLEGAYARVGAKKDRVGLCNRYAISARTSPQSSERRKMKWNFI